MLGRGVEGCHDTGVTHRRGQAAIVLKQNRLVNSKVLEVHGLSKRSGHTTPQKGGERTL